VVLLATGSEVAIARDAAALLEARGVGADLVSMPCQERFDEQDAAYKADILPGDALIVSVEAGVTRGWERYTGVRGCNIGVDSFGASAPIEALYGHFGLTPAAIADRVMAALAG
jgi:transketolase